MSPESRAAAVEHLLRLAAVHPRVLGVVELEHGQLTARVAYESWPHDEPPPEGLWTLEAPGLEAEPLLPGGRRLAQVEETIHLGGSTVGSSSGESPPGERSPRELARHAVVASRRTTWELGEGLVLTRRPALMGVLNVTAESFSDGGQFLDPERAIERGLEMVAEGVDWIDIGGESTRPGAAPMSEEEELARVLPVVAGLAGRTAAVLSIDTSKAEVARQAVAAGARVVNDVTALRGDPAMGAVIAQSGAACVLMHMQGTPRTMQDSPSYADPVTDVGRFLRRALAAAVAAGIPAERVILDPGIGFGKTLEHNLALLARLPELTSLGRPLLVGASRKSFLGRLLDLPVDRRGGVSVVVHALAAQAGAALVRAHDTLPTRHALDLVAAYRQVGDRGESS